MRNQRFAGVVLTPVNAIQIDVHKARVWVVIPHIHHAVLDERTGNVEPALDHVLRPGAKLELIKGSLRQDAMVEPVEQRSLQFSGAVAGAAFYTEAFLRKILPRPAEA